MTQRSQGNLGALLISALFVIAGGIVLYDTTTYADRDSQVFPQAIALLLILFAGISLVTEFLRPGPAEGFGTGTWWRRVLLVATMFLACLAMPLTGFLPAAAIAFAGGLIAAMHDRWTTVNATLYLGSAVVVMGGFYALFKLVLKVPLP